VCPSVQPEATLLRDKQVWDHETGRVRCAEVSSAPHARCPSHNGLR
jgi:hypothetical protein